MYSILYYILLFFNGVQLLRNHQVMDLHEGCGKASDYHPPKGISCCEYANNHISQMGPFHGADSDVQDNS